jgi:hypothetical protein
MSPRIILVLAAFGSVFPWGSIETAADERISEERRFLTDFRTVYECLQRMARDRNLRLRRSGGGWGCSGGEDADRLKERFAIVADSEKLCIDEEPVLYVAEIGFRSDQRDRTMLRTIKLDPDTGELSVPEGINLGKFKLGGIGFGFSFMDINDKIICESYIERDYLTKGIKVAITSARKDGRALCREFMTALESKLKLAAKLKEAKAKTAPQKSFS